MLTELLRCVITSTSVVIFHLKASTHASVSLHHGLTVSFTVILSYTHCF